MKPIPLIAAGLVVAALLLRWRRLSSHVQVAGLVAAGGLAVYGAGVVHPPSLEVAIRQLGESLGTYAYLLVGVMAFLETGAGIGLVAPGELAVILGGVTAGQGHTDIAVMIAVVWGCAVAGDITSYLLGRRLGGGFIRRHGPRLRLTTARIEQVERFFATHGGKTIIVGRFIGVVRSLAPFIAGASKMPPRRFLPVAFVAAGMWSAACCLLGYFFWHSLDQAAAIAKQGTLSLVAAVALLVAGTMAYRYLRDPENRRRVRRWVRRREPATGGPDSGGDRPTARGDGRPAYADRAAGSR